jgi:hypothetical protein
MQRQILETLDEAKAAMPNYRGSQHDLHVAERSWIGVGHAVEQTFIRVPRDVYDLRCSAKYLARQSGALDRESTTMPFKASFSRAVRGLVQRQLLTPLWLVPVAEVQRWGFPDRDLLELADGTYFRWESRQIRFVKR